MVSHFPWGNCSIICISLPLKEKTQATACVFCLFCDQGGGVGHAEHTDVGLSAVNSDLFSFIVRDIERAVRGIGPSDGKDSAAGIEITVTSAFRIQREGGFGGGVIIVDIMKKKKHVRKRK